MLNIQVIQFFAFIALPAFIVSMLIVSLLERRTALKTQRPTRKRRRLRLLTWLSSLIWEDEKAAPATAIRKPRAGRASKRDVR